MTPEVAKAFASLVVSVMSFLGWSTNEYVNFLPPQVRSEIVSPYREEQSPAASSTPKVTETKKPKTQLPKKTQPQTTAPKVSVQKPAQPKPKVETQETKPQTHISVEPVTPLVPKPVPAPEIKQSGISVEDKVKQSTVNVYCSRIIGNKIQTSTGSGVVIDPSGVIITNAHVAEYFLLAQNGNNTTCYIRTGSPATNSYKAKLVYLPEVWIQRNKNNLNLETLTGTGEDDYALLVITERVSKSAPNIPLSYLDIKKDNFSLDDNIILSAYPAGFSDIKIINTALYSLLKYSQVTRLSSFDKSHTDVINTSPTVIAEHGSSGGVVADESGSLGALIVATTQDKYSNKKNIQAITLPYIQRSIKINSGKSFDYLILHARDEANTFEKDEISNLSGILLGN